MKLCTRRACTPSKQVTAPRCTSRLGPPSALRARGDANRLVTGTLSPAPDTHWPHPRTASALAPELHAVDPRVGRRALPTPGCPSPAVPAGLPATACPTAAPSPERRSRREPQRTRCWTEAQSPAVRGTAAPHPRHSKAPPYTPADVSIENDSESARPGLRLPAPAPTHTQQFAPRRRLRCEGQGSAGRGMREEKPLPEFCPRSC